MWQSWQGLCSRLLLQRLLLQKHRPLSQEQNSSFLARRQAHQPPLLLMGQRGQVPKKEYFLPPSMALTEAFELTAGSPRDEKLLHARERLNLSLLKNGCVFLVDTLFSFSSS